MVLGNHIIPRAGRSTDFRARIGEIGWASHEKIRNMPGRSACQQVDRPVAFFALSARLAFFARFGARAERLGAERIVADA